MSIKTNAVQIMDDSTLLDRIVNSLPGRILIAATQTALGSAALLAVFLFWQAGDPLLLKYTVVVGVGLIAGFSARGLLKGRTRVLAALDALVNAALGLAALAALSGGFLGIRPFDSWGRAPDWGGLSQLLAAAPGALLAVLAFRPAPKVDLSPAPPAPVQLALPEPRPAVKERTPKLSPASGAKKSQPQTRTAPKKQASPAAVKTRAQKKAPPRAVQKTIPQKAAPQLAAAKKGAATARPRAARSTKKALQEIKFIGAEEHICPYCLDPVTEDDPRGVKVCPICKTQHHADCWGITGACQIPHAH